MCFLGREKAIDSTNFSYRWEPFTGPNLLAKHYLQSKSFRCTRPSSTLDWHCWYQFRVTHVWITSILNIIVICHTVVDCWFNLNGHQLAISFPSTPIRRNGASKSAGKIEWTDHRGQLMAGFFDENPQGDEHAEIKGGLKTASLFAISS